ncbi:hypothetical protein GCK32_009055 [Trichostrongylus colubriformis]|uniref:Uncharacterized protein n=1 Tax=Trichostrongylus colubriformis TaxID=6319 RepID=A0AAN8F294_TRICO
MTLNCLHQRHHVSYIMMLLVSCHPSPFIHWSIKNRHSMDNIHLFLQLLFISCSPNEL